MRGGRPASADAFRGVRRPKKSGRDNDKRRLSYGVTVRTGRYRSWNPQESADREEMLRRLRNGDDLYTRDNPVAHLTTSAWVVSPGRSRALMAYHNLYGARAWLGGHADGQRDLGCRHEGGGRKAA